MCHLFNCSLSGKPNEEPNEEPMLCERTTIEAGDQVIVYEGFDKFQIKSLQAVCDLVKKRGGIAIMSDDISEGALLLNYLYYRK